jgi:hypothetical protein
MAISRVHPMWVLPVRVPHRACLWFLSQS